MFRPMLYLAAPLFNDRERSFNLELAAALSPYADIFLPQRDGDLLVELVKDGVPVSLAEKRVFDQDFRAMARADALVAVLDGAHVDEGVAVEIGVMRALGKMCIGFQTDVRRALPTGNNPMISGAMHFICENTHDLVAIVRRCQPDIVTVGRDMKKAS